VSITIRVKRGAEMPDNAAEFALQCALEFRKRAPWDAVGVRNGCGYLSRPEAWSAFVYRTPMLAIVVVLEAAP